MKVVLITNIVWDTDGQPKPDYLPTTVRVLESELEGIDAADLLSDTYGYCVESLGLCYEDEAPKLGVTL